jgi:hypothetical protein
MNHMDAIPQPRPRLSDEAAAQMADFLYQFIGDFESAYLVQICRYRRRTRVEPDRPDCPDPQMPLFDNLDPPF